MTNPFSISSSSIQLYLHTAPLICMATIFGRCQCLARGKSWKEAPGGTSIGGFLHINEEDGRREEQQAPKCVGLRLQRRSVKCRQPSVFAPNCSLFACRSKWNKVVALRQCLGSQVCPGWSRPLLVIAIHTQSVSASRLGRSSWIGSTRVHCWSCSCSDARYKCCSSRAPV